MNQLQTTPKRHFIISFVGNEEIKVTDIQAEKIMDALTQPNNPKFIRIGDEMFATHQITRISVNRYYV